MGCFHEYLNSFFVIQETKPHVRLPNKHANHGEDLFSFEQFGNVKGRCTRSYRDEPTVVYWVGGKVGFSRECFCQAIRRDTVPDLLRDQV